MSETKIEDEFDLVKKTVTVKDDGSEYEFRIPSLLDEVKIGTRMRRLRLAADPLDDPGGAIDPDTLAYLKAASYFEILLVAADNADWAWGKSAEGKRIVDSSKIPIDKTDTVLRVASKAFWAINRFRSGTSASEQSGSENLGNSESV